MRIKFIEETSFSRSKMVKIGKKRSFLSRLRQNGCITGNQRPQKHNFHFIGTKNFDHALILMKKLIFLQQKAAKNG